MSHACSPPDIALLPLATGAVYPVEIAEYVERMITSLEQRPDLPQAARSAGIRIIVGAVAVACLQQDRLIGLHGLDQACAAIGALGAKL